MRREATLRPWIYLLWSSLTNCEVVQDLCDEFISALLSKNYTLDVA